ncbi:MAG: DUF1501 domain-containing protein [Verrucomicrobiia bacterium]|jgi:uncharacterized protein (DUF1501 family)
MLTFATGKFRHCDGLSRRSFLKAGALGIGGLSFADLLRAEATAGVGSSNKAIINVHLDGGPPQMDMIDPKPDAPIEYRGEFKSIRTAIPGLHLTELMPRMAKAAGKFAFLRSLQGSAGRHDAFQCQSGYSFKELQSIGGRPAMGCVLSKLLATPKDTAPTFVDIMQGRGLVRNSTRPGFLGPAYKPFRPDISHMFHRELEKGMQGELSRLGPGHTINLGLIEGLTAGRMGDRVALLKNMDRIRRDIDASGQMSALDEFTQQAVNILTSGKFAEAMDLEKEDPKMLERYTPRVPNPDPKNFTMEGAMAGRKLLLARRLVEAGVRCVSVSISDFDTHSDNFNRMRTIGPLVDHALTTLVEDLEERGMLDDVSIVAWGEFGRTPKINAKAGRDHWPRVGMGIMAGGGIKTGQVIGSTDRTASDVTSRPIQYQDVIATLYHNLGLDARAITVEDTTGRPQYLVDHGAPIKELV